MSPSQAGPRAGGCRLSWHLSPPWADGGRLLVHGSWKRVMELLVLQARVFLASCSVLWFVENVLHWKESFHGWWVLVLLLCILKASACCSWSPLSNAPKREAKLFEP